MATSGFLLLCAQGAWAETPPPPLPSFGLPAELAPTPKVGAPTAPSIPPMAKPTASAFNTAPGAAPQASANPLADLMPPTPESSEGGKPAVSTAPSVPPLPTAPSTLTNAAADIPPAPPALPGLPALNSGENKATEAASAVPPLAPPTLPGLPAAPSISDVFKPDSSEKKKAEASKPKRGLEIHLLSEEQRRQAAARRGMSLGAMNGENAISLPEVNVAPGTKTWKTTLAPAIVAPQTSFNYRRYVLPEAIYRASYDDENLHLPKRVTREDYANLLFQSVAKNDVEATRAILNRGISVNLRDANGETPLATAQRQGALATEALLRARGASL